MWFKYLNVKKDIMRIENNEDIIKLLNHKEIEDDVLNNITNETVKISINDTSNKKKISKK
jgi:hypothetical protein